MSLGEEDLAALLRHECTSWGEPMMPERFTPAARCHRGRARGLAMCGAAGVLALSVLSGSVDPRVWWQATQHVAQGMMQQAGLAPAQPQPMPPGTSPRNAVLGVEPVVPPAPTAAGSRPVSPSPGGEHGSLASSQGTSTSAGPVKATVTTGSGANGHAPPGIKIGPATANGNGLSGSVGEGPVNMGGSIGPGGATGCVGVSGVANVCGSTGQAAPPPPGLWP
jgi:hypothetical protein